MFTAHLPSGYLLAQFTHNKYVNSTPTDKYAWFFACLLGSVIADTDLLHFYFIDNRQTNHHMYWTHIPIYWTAIIALAIFFLVVTSNRKYINLVIVFYAAILLHLSLDSIAGGIAWGYPWTDTLHSVVDVEAKYGWWVLNFIFHWTFFIEICVWAAAITIWIRDIGGDKNTVEERAPR